MSDDIKVLGISGSLRSGSNSAALQEAIGLVPPGMSIELADISGIPLYNEDVYALGFPPAVERFREQIRAADALLFATPEYNYSMAGVLKNAIDWASRPPEQPFSGKPAAILGASAGRFGTARAQYHLRQTLVFLDVHPLNKPEVMISSAQNAFDAQGRLLDDKARELIQQQLQALQLCAACAVECLVTGEPEHEQYRRALRPVLLAGLSGAPRTPAATSHRACRGNRRRDHRQSADAVAPAADDRCLVLPRPCRSRRIRTRRRLSRGPAPAHRPADLHLDDPGRGVAPRQPGQRPGDPPRPGQPDDRRPWHRPHRGVAARRAPRPRRAVVDRAALRAARHRPGLRPSSRPAALAGAGVTFTLLAGALDGRQAPCRLYSPLLGADLACDDASTLQLALDPHFEYGRCRWKAGWKWAASISR